ncbi:MAG: electron transfer flavoprotein subunit alpha/FixB family protein, partial [Thermoleophilaceae bacterium]
MSGILVVAESRRGDLREVSLELVGAALALKEQAGGRVAVAIVGAAATEHADALGATGVDEVLTVASPTESFEA